jgi:hypothetical protein
MGKASKTSKKPAAAKPAKPAKAKPTAKPKPTPNAGGLRVVVEEDGLRYVDAGGGYAVAVDAAGGLRCKNARGATLASVPKAVRDGKVGEQLGELAEWLEGHARACAQTVETWMLRSLRVPRKVIETTWRDPAWRRPLENVVVTDLDGRLTGFLRGVDPRRGVGIVNLDGETEWLDDEAVRIPHPIAIGELDGFRELATELAIEQGIAQLHRETYARPAGLDGTRATLSDFARGRFAQLIHAIGKAKRLGYPVRGGFAVCPVWEGGRVVEARYWIGSEAPDEETFTGDLMWLAQKALPLAEVGGVAFSEGMRMAAAIYAARVTSKESDDE